MYSDEESIVTTIKDLDLLFEVFRLADKVRCAKERGGGGASQGARPPCSTSRLADRSDWPEV